MSKKEAPQRLIHIKAVSEIYSVHTIVPENIAVKVLEEIRDGFSDLANRYTDYQHSKLVVHTCVHNPTLW